jgi:hypothetical protein
MQSSPTSSFLSERNQQTSSWSSLEEAAGSSGGGSEGYIFSSINEGPLSPTMSVDSNFTFANNHAAFRNTNGHCSRLTSMSNGNLLTRDRFVEENNRPRREARREICIENDYASSNTRRDIPATGI